MYMFTILGMIIFLDGGVCTGKTSLVREFEKDNFVVIPEHTDLIDEDEEKRIFSLNDDNLILKEFMKIEKVRNMMILSALIEKRDIVVDRSVMSTLSFYYAIGKYELIENYLKENQVNYPEKIYFLDVPYEERTRRAYQRGDDKEKISSDILYKKSFNEKIKEFFLNFQKTTKIEYIDTSNINSKQLKRYILNRELTTQSNVLNDKEYKEEIITDKYYELNFDI